MRLSGHTGHEEWPGHLIKEELVKSSRFLLYVLQVKCWHNNVEMVHSQHHHKDWHFSCCDVTFYHEMGFTHCLSIILVQHTRKWWISSWFPFLWLFQEIFLNCHLNILAILSFVSKLVSLLSFKSFCWLLSLLSVGTFLEIFAMITFLLVTRIWLFNNLTTTLQR